MTRTPWLLALTTAAALASGAPGCGTMRSDTEIESAVTRQLHDDQRFVAAPIRATVVNGVVTLSGTAPTDEIRHDAQDVVDDVAGVRSVRNEIRVVPSVASPSDAVR